MIEKDYTQSAGIAGGGRCARVNHRGCRHHIRLFGRAIRRNVHLNCWDGCKAELYPVEIASLQCASSTMLITGAQRTQQRLIRAVRRHATVWKPSGRS